MPQSLVAIYLHIVFSTKNRRVFLRDPQLREMLHTYLAGICKTLDCPPIRINGVDDHVHILMRLGRSVTIGECVKELKRASNTWIKKQGPEFHDFAWQAGYAGFSVSHSNIGQVSQYIANQSTHHRKTPFEDELRALLRKHEIEFDEQYLWD